MYKSPLSCSHTLVSDRIDGTFDVILKACPYGSGYDCPHVIKIFWQSIIYTIEYVGEYLFPPLHQQSFLTPPLNRWKLQVFNTEEESANSSSSNGH